MLWLLDEDDAQKALNGLHGWRTTLSGRSLPIFDPPVPRLERDRLPLPPDWPLACFSLRGGPLPDFWWAGDHRSFVVSSRLLDVMALPPHAAQVLPILLFAEHPGARAMDYRFMRVLASAPCMDRTRSTFEERTFVSHRTGLTETMIQARRFLLDMSVAPPAELFWAEEKPDQMIATEALAARVQNEGFTGLTFGDPLDLDEWGAPRMARIQGGTVPIRSSAIGVLPTRIGPRPPYMPDPALPERLRAIERSVRHRLPAEYVRVMQDPPARLLASEGCRYDLVTDPDEVVHLNNHVRDDPTVPWLRDNGPWPEDWLVIGHDQCGNYWTLDLAAPVSPVLFYDHDFAAAQIAAVLIDNFALEVAERYLGPEPIVPPDADA
jgi:hypothetical protein